MIVDRDADDCRKLKRKLEGFAALAGLSTRSSPADDQWVVVNRLAIEELEAWYFGDWDAVRAAYPRAPSSIPTNRKYRDPDAISGGTWEAFERILRRAGYFAGGLRKTEAARAIAPNMNPGANTSASFRALLAALKEMTLKEPRCPSTV